MKYIVTSELSRTCNLEIHNTYNTLQEVFDFFSGFATGLALLNPAKAFHITMLDDNTVEVILVVQKDKRDFRFIVEKIKD